MSATAPAVPAAPARTPSTTGSAAAIDAAAARGGAALVGYLPAGYPDLATSLDAVRAMVAGGVDVIELGLPYSDPVMDGPVIARAAEESLRAGTRTRDVLALVEALRGAVAAETGGTGGAGVPLLVMSYWAPVLRYGTEAFARDLASAGAAGLITPDLIPDEAGGWLEASDAHGLERVFLVAPSSTPPRLASTAAACRGWVYAASLMGVTGERASVGGGAEALVARTRAAGAERVCVGLGVSTPAQAGEVARYADGVIVGSALVRALGDGGPAAVERLTAALAAGTATPGPAPDRPAPDPSAPDHAAPDPSAPDHAAPDHPAPAQPTHDAGRSTAGAPS